MADLHKVKEELERLGFDVTHDYLRMVREYVDAFEKAEPLVAEGLTGDFRKIAEYNGVILAGHKYAEPQYGYEFVTWAKGTAFDGSPMVRDGRYFSGDEPDIFIHAKHDFAVRSGLVEETFTLSVPECAAMLHAIEYVGGEFDALDDDHMDVLDGVSKRLEAMLDGTVIRPPEQGLTMK
jgi:hypothetical protein